MGCCCGKSDGMDTSSRDPSRTESTPLLEAFAKPQYIDDTEAHGCFKCHQAFDMMERRHHCRRCQNVFCGKCSKYRRPVLIFDKQNPQRLCRQCYDEVPSENDFVARHLPLLKGGGTFAQRILVGKRPIFMKLSSDMSQLEYREPGKRGQTNTLPLHNIESVGAVIYDSPVTFQIVNKNGNTVKLDASNDRERDAWVSAIGEASHRVRAPNLKTKVESERRKQEKRRQLFESQAAKTQRKNERMANRQKIAQKYNLRGNQGGAGALGNAQPNHFQ
mmetsp:Transcript_16109/g.21290  ORF Transcript_16109/g.21290 Transcript_16109/m.21290 type:complete len:275 (+) Transcript_16109:135-959(+)